LLISLYGLLEANSKSRQPGIAAVIRLMRLTREWTLEDLGSKAKIQASEISLLESGRRNPRLEMLQRLADAFGVRCSEMVALAEEFELKARQLKRDDG
jgi:transcriptional regulator with XRE-family HTH domain